MGDGRLSGTSTRNHRILVVDDNPEIHRDFVRVLTSAAKPALEALDAQLFGERPQRHAPAYLIESASQGEQAVEMARAAIARGEPYDLAFVDARMPPGMDGVQTIAQLWELDHSLHVVLCSAYADYGWDEIAAAIGVTDRCLVLRKPFDPLEVRQLASALTHKTELLRVQTDHVARLDQLVRERTSELEAALESLRAEGVHRAEMERALAHAQRMQALGQLTAGIAHEINNPLLVVRGHLEMIEDELDHRGLDDLIRPVQATIAAANRIANVVRDVRSFATPQDGPVEPVEIAPVIESALGLLGASSMRGITLTRAFEAVPRAQALGRRLEQVVVNLLSNASKAFPPGHARAPEIRIDVFAPSTTEIAIEVTDNGGGIRADHMPRLFDPFFTTRTVGHGAGLGLTVSKGIVEGFGGRIEVESEHGLGTTVRVVLPASEAQAEPADATPAPAPPPITTFVAPLDVLLIDDDPALIRMLGRMLGRHRTTTCTSADEALQLLGERAFDIVLCDIMMPGMTGAELLQHLRRTAPERADRVILMTGALLGEDLGELRASMTGRWLEKPFSRNELEATLRRVAQSFADRG